VQRVWRLVLQPVFCCGPPAPIMSDRIVNWRPQEVFVLRHWTRVFATAVSLLTAFGAQAGDARDCADLPDDAVRLACYDAAVGRTPAKAGALVAVDPVAEFGLTEVQKRAQDPERARVASPESISAVVTAVGRQSTGELVVTLENGQVWAQAEVMTMARAAPGDTVTVRKAALGSYVMVTANRVAMRVRRVR